MKKIISIARGQKMLQPNTGSTFLSVFFYNINQPVQDPGNIFVKYYS